MSRFKMGLSAEYVRLEASRGTDLVETVDLEADATSLVYEIGQLAHGAVFTKRGRTLRYVFRSRPDAEKWAALQLARLKARAEEARARRAQRSAHTTALKVGDVMVSSWGYEQTNVEYYEVTAVVGRCTVELRRIAQTFVEAKGPMSESVIAAVGQYIGEAKRYRVSPHETIKISSSQSAVKWDGKPDYQSHYA